MRVTEVRFQPIEDGPCNNERLQAFCSITLDGGFVVRDIKVVLGDKGLFVTMPSRKLHDRCHFCGVKNHLRARFCNECGGRLNENRAIPLDGSRANLHADIAHPIHSECRAMIEAEVLAAYSVHLSGQEIARGLAGRVRRREAVA